MPKTAKALPALSERLLSDLLKSGHKGIVRVEEYPALRLRVHPAHVAVSFAYRLADRRRREVRLGRWPQDGISVLRSGHDAIEELVAAGSDPQGRLWHGRVLISLGEMVEKWEAANFTKTAHKRARTVRRVFADLLSRPARQVRSDEISRALDAQSVGPARDGFNALRTVYAWGVKRGHVDFSPMVQVEPRKTFIRDVYPEISFGRVIWQEAATMPSPLREIARVQLLLAARSGEVAGMTWGEVDLERGWWTLQAARAKSGRAHTFALVPPLVSELRRLKALQPTQFGDLVFRSPEIARVQAYHKRQMMKRFVSAARTCGADCPDGVIFHDLRRMMGRAMSEAGFPRLVVHQCLNHGAAAGVGATVLDQTYMAQRQIDETRDALAWWAGQIIGTNPQDSERLCKSYAKEMRREIHELARVKR